MRKYSLALVALSAVFALQGHSEFKLGVMGGGNFTTFTSSVRAAVSLDQPAPNTVYTGNLGPSGQFGYQVGGLIRYEVETWMFESNVLYTSRAANWAGAVENGSDEVRTRVEIRMNQIEVPLIGYYKFPTEIADFRFGVGFYGSYGIGKIKSKYSLSNVPGSIVQTSDESSWSDFGFRRFNFGGLIGLGSNFKIGDEAKIGLELRTQFTFNNMADKLNPAFGLGGEKIGIATVDLLASYVF